MRASGNVVSRQAIEPVPANSFTNSHIVSSRVVNPILSTEPARHVAQPGGENDREYQRSHQWDSRHNAYGPSGVGSNLFFPNGNIPPPPMIVAPPPAPVEQPPPIPEGPEFYDFGRGYERDKRGMYGVYMSEAPYEPRKMSKAPSVRMGERANVSSNHMAYDNYRPRDEAARYR